MSRVLRSLKVKPTPVALNPLVILRLSISTQPLFTLTGFDAILASKLFNCLGSVRSAHFASAPLASPRFINLATTTPTCQYPPRKNLPNPPQIPTK